LRRLDIAKRSGVHHFPGIRLPLLLKPTHETNPWLCPAGYRN
jgi:hypothetical protein